MAKSKEEKIKAQIEKAKLAKRRAIEKQLAKQKDPEEIKKRIIKQRESRQRQIEKAMAKRNSKNSAKTISSVKKTQQKD